MLFLANGFHAGCLGRVVQSKAKFTWLQQSRDFTCAADGFFPSATDCCSGLYYACLSGVAYEQHCPGDEVYNPTDGRCVLLSAASCGSLCESGSSSTASSTQSTTTTTSTTESTTQITSPTTIRTTPDGGGFDCPTSNGFFAIPDTCGSEYYACVDGSPYVEVCPDNSIFDPVALICVKAEDASCIETTTVSSTTTEPPTTTTLAPPFSCPATGNYPYPGDCTLYYVCAGGSYIISHCPAGQVFNPDISFCDSPANVPGCNFHGRIEYFNTN